MKNTIGIEESIKIEIKNITQIFARSVEKNLAKIVELKLSTSSRYKITIDGFNSKGKLILEKEYYAIRPNETYNINNEKLTIDLAGEDVLDVNEKLVAKICKEFKVIYSEIIVTNTSKSIEI